MTEGKGFRTEPCRNPLPFYMDENHVSGPEMPVSLRPAER